MTYQEYAKERDALVSYREKTNLHRHTANRLAERYGIPDFSHAAWTHFCYECAIEKGCEIVGTTHNATLYSKAFNGDPVIWVYDRDRKCVVTVITEDMVWRYTYFAEFEDIEKASRERNMRVYGKPRSKRWKGSR